MVVAITCDPGSLAGMIKQAWCSALGWCRMLCHTGDFPFRPVNYVAGCDDDAGLLDIEPCCYLAKGYTKVNGTGERNFSIVVELGTYGVPVLLKNDCSSGCNINLFLPCGCFTPERHCA